MSAGELHTTCHRSTPRDLVAKAVELSALPMGDEFVVPSVLSLPVRDIVGDIVHADRFTFNAHRRRPVVDFEHRRHPEAGDRIAGWADTNYGRPGGKYSVLKARLDVPGVGVRDVPIGVTFFDRDDPFQRQICFGVRDGQWPGVSLEFMPNWAVAKSLGRSPVELRDAYEFPAGDVKCYAHCVEPVCQHATAVLKALPPEYDALAKVLRDGRIRNEALHPHIVKSLARYRPTATLVRVEKAMDPTDSPETVYDPTAADEGAGMGDSAPALNGVTALYNHAQALIDAADQLAQDMESSDAPELRKLGEKLKAKVEAVAEEAKAAADKHDAKLNGSKGEEGAAEGEGADEESDDSSLPDMDTDDDGELKAMRPVYRTILKACRAKRYSLAEIRKGVADAAGQHPGAVDAAAVAAASQLKLQLKKLRQEREELSPRLKLHDPNA